MIILSNYKIGDCSFGFLTYPQTPLFLSFSLLPEKW